MVNVERDIHRALTAKQFRGWEIYESLCPLGEERLDYRTASLVQLLFNINRGKDQKPLTLDECLIPFIREPKQDQTPEQQFKILQLWAAAMASEPANPKADTSAPEKDMIEKARAAMLAAKGA